MQVIFKGGPFDGELKEVPTIGQCPAVPMPHFHTVPPLNPDTKWIDEPIDPEMEIPTLVYELKEYWIDGKLHHYEYHYQGR